MSAAARVPEKPLVLVVDDEPAMLRVLVWALRDVGTTVAHSAEEALVLLDRHEFGAVVSDNSMPGTSGVELLKVIYDRHPHVRRIMHSGSAPDELADLLTAGVVEHFVPKPGHTAVAEICAALFADDPDDA